MMLFRSACNNDLDAIYQLAHHSGVGMTTLPKDIDFLGKRLAISNRSFSQTIAHPSNEYYLFVLEDSESGKVVGTSAIEAATGQDTPFYSYKILKHTNICRSLNIRTDSDILNLVNDNQGLSEMCTLFLEPDYRRNSNGLLLSRARFLFMAQFPTRFAPKIIAELRGVSNEKGISPFWNAVGRHFFKMPFAKADLLTLATNKQFIADLMPRIPIYVCLLPRKVQALIGKPHHSTVPAMNILVHEGFRYNHYVDIFDAGPTIEATCADIRTIRSSQTMTINSLTDDVAGKRFLLANTKLDFRAVVSQVLVDQQQNSCIVSKMTAQLLQVTLGDQIRVAPLQTSENISNNESHYAKQSSCPSLS